MAAESPNAIYFANRANAYLELKKYEECVNDCDEAIKVDPKYVKSYFRKSLALLRLQKMNEALDMISVAVELEPSQQSFVELKTLISKEIEEDSKVPLDHPSRKVYETLTEWVTKAGGDVSKTKIRWYTENFRGLHATCDIKVGEVVMFIPDEQLVTQKVCGDSPLV